MSQQELTIMDAAYTIRYHLGEMLNHADAEALLRELNLILKNAEANEESEERICELLEQNENTRKWMEDFLNPSDDTRKSSFQPLPGKKTQPIGGITEKYVCSIEGCSEYWYRKKPSQEIPCCMNHPDITLEIKE